MEVEEASEAERTKRFRKAAGRPKEIWQRPRCAREAAHTDGGDAGVATRAALARNVIFAT